jgi:hypothetical protein
MPIFYTLLILLILKEFKNTIKYIYIKACIFLI